MKGKWLLATVLLVGCASTGEEAESTAKSLYVAPNGSDKNTGTLKHRLKQSGKRHKKRLPVRRSTCEKERITRR